ncbi:methylenetetrahydrofolate reductase [Pseudonocardia sp. C8]|uniref:methylenetetrahydrofolate reductase n=1 Tax=Pseudonocardia sp. C8 TaxID=2762759 RepID=UPI00164301DF|nr:methylenetetrahydrofolate reductase [Pseudonocardia sp. C8]MBC3194221.1 methylenetetrahydrofolate reductase [Pseudonocardia sp. C8]
MGGSTPGSRRATARLLARPRFELLPLRGALDATAALPAGATVTVTASPRQGVDATVELTEALSGRGFRAVPHLAARQFTGRAQLAGVLDRLDRAGVRDVFVVAGDAPEPAGEFPDGLSLLRAMAELGHPMTSVGVPSYPEGLRGLPGDTLWQLLREKQEHATYTVTQLCFDADTVCTFAARARERGVTLPVVAGIPGAVDAGRLLRVSLRIGVGSSARFLRGHRSLAGKLLRPNGYRPDGLVRRLGAHVAAGRCELDGLHVYTFNQVEATLRWLQLAHRRVAA